MTEKIKETQSFEESFKENESLIKNAQHSSVNSTEDKDSTISEEVKGQSFADLMQSNINLRKFNITIDKLIDCGAQFGQKKSLTHPTMYNYIHQSKDMNFSYATDGRLIINLDMTLKIIQEIYALLESHAKNGNKILIVSTKKELETTIEKYAKDSSFFWVNKRWLAGNLTNFLTLNKNLKKLQNIKKALLGDNIYSKTKREIYQEERYMNKLLKCIGGLIGMRELPKLIIVIGNEPIVIKEAKALKIPVIGIVDTNTNVQDITHVIPCNPKHSVVELILKSFTDAVLNGIDQFSINKTITNIKGDYRQKTYDKPSYSHNKFNKDNNSELNKDNKNNSAGFNKYNTGFNKLNKYNTGFNKSNNNIELNQENNNNTEK